MAFKNPGIIDVTTVTGGQGTFRGLTTRLRGALNPLRDLLARLRGLRGRFPRGAPISGTPFKPVLGPEAGLFGGRLPPSREGVEKQALLQGNARRFEAFHPTVKQRGPFVMAEQGTGSTSIRPLPAHAATVFSDMLKEIA